jgi:glycerol-3-phosphate acyltransferase PlsY
MASVLVAERLVGGTLAPAAAGFAAIIGHVYPVWFRLRGGKGVATACGVFAVLAPWAALLALGVFVGGVLATRYVSVGSVLASLALPPIAYALAGSAPVVGAALAASALIVFRHRSNLSRLRMGTEPRVGARA